MSLFGSLQIANNALSAAQVGLQVTGNNIANANTPGYLREEVVFEPAPPQLVANLPLGLGVRVSAIIQKTDRFLAERLRGAISDLSYAEAKESSFLQLEAMLGELTETDLSTSLTDFFAAMEDILNQPEDVSVRNFAGLQGETVANEFQHLVRRAREARSDVNGQIVSVADDVNRLVEEIAQLNVKIVVTEGGATTGSDAVGLRDQRERALGDMADLVGIRAVEQPNGSMAVFVGGDFLVFEGEYRTVSIAYTPDRGLNSAEAQIADTSSPLSVAAGKLAGLYESRDDVLGGFLDDLDELAQSLIFEFNKTFSGGQGLTGYDALASESAVADADAALDQAGLAFVPVNGSFQLLVHNTRTGTIKTVDVSVSLNGLDDDTTLVDLAATLDDVDGIIAEVTPDLRLSIASESSELEFGFANDTSGALAALGLNTFFAGSSADDIAVNDVIREDPSKFAASLGGFGHDAQNVALLADLANQPMDSHDGRSLLGMYENLVAEVAQSSAVTKAVSEGFRVFRRTLESQQLGVSGVSIDDEAVKMIAFQRAYQASARYIAAINELLNSLINL